MESPPSVIRAAEDAAHATLRDLFRPFRPERWLALGFACVLDQCTQLADNGIQFVVRAGADSAPPPVKREAGTWLAAHPLLAVAAAAVVLAVAVAIGAVALWITCRGRFVYLDDVATGRADIRRPWSEHGGRAGSHFVWALGFSLATFLGALALALPLVWAGMSLARSGARAGPIVVLALGGSALLALVLFSVFFVLAMRDFVAPLQWYTDQTCGGALALFLRLARGHVGLLVVYVLLKITFALLAGILGLLVCCLTCCLAALPFLQHTLLQPILYFERRWSLELLAQLGYRPPTALVPEVPEPAAPDPSAASAPEPSPA